MSTNEKTQIKNENTNKELSDETLTCIAEIILNYYHYMKENACVEQSSALHFQPLKKEDN